MALAMCEKIRKGDSAKVVLALRGLVFRRVSITYFLSPGAVVKGRIRLFGAASSQVAAEISSCVEKKPLQPQKCEMHVAPKPKRRRPRNHSPTQSPNAKDKTPPPETPNQQARPSPSSTGGLAASSRLSFATFQHRNKEPTSSRRLADIMPW